MPLDWSHDPREIDEVSGWAIPLDETSDPPPTLLPLPQPSPPDNSTAPDSFLLQASDPEPTDEFHPRLKRFGEAA